MIEHVANHTNLYSSQSYIDKRSPSIVTSKNEIERYMGMLLKMTIIKHHIIGYFGNLAQLAPQLVL